MHLAARCALVPSLLAVFLTGCATQPTSAPIHGGPVLPSAITGSAQGGQAPITGAAIYLMAAGTGGYNTASTSLLTSGSPGVQVDGAGRGYVTTDAGGNFTITADYTCPSADTQVYLLATGGNPGLGGSQTNAAVSEMDALGSCGALTASTHVVINELTTVAAIAALAPFANADGSSFSTSASNVLGLKNAFITASNLVNPFIGQVNQKTPSGIGTVPYREINTLGDILAACVNSSGQSNTPCATLFTATTPAGGTAPTNTLQAMLNIARYPAQNVAALYQMATATGPFQPMLSGNAYNNFTQSYDPTPNDWSIAIVYQHSSMPDPNYLAIDSQGNVWSASSNNSTAVQLSNTGALNYIVDGNQAAGMTTNQLHQISVQNNDHLLAVDLSDNLWVDNNSYGITKITSAGVLVNPTASWGYIPGPGTNSAQIAYTSYPASWWKAGFGGITVGTDNTIWLGSADYSHSGLTHTTTDGVGLTFYDLANAGLRNPSTVAIDNDGNLWMNTTLTTDRYVVVKVKPDGTALSGATGGTTSSGYPVDGSPRAIAIDHSNNAWIANEDKQTLIALRSDGTPLPGSPFSGGGLLFPHDVAVDGDGHIWVANFNRTNGGVSEFDAAGTALSNSRGFFPGIGYASLGAVSIDASGNVWVADWQGGAVEELVGLGAPTVTPIALATKTNKLGVRP